MIIVFGRPVLIGSFYVTPIARHVPDGVTWRDILSYDRETIMSEIDDDLPQDILDKLRADTDIFDVIVLDTEDDEEEVDGTLPGPPGRGRDKPERDNNRPLPGQARGRAKKLADQRGVPEKVFDDAISVDDVADVFRREMHFDQALGGNDLNAPRKVARSIEERLSISGFEFGYEMSDTEDKVKEKALKKEVFRRGR